MLQSQRSALTEPRADLRKASVGCRGNAHSPLVKARGIPAVFVAVLTRAGKLVSALSPLYEGENPRVTSEKSTTRRDLAVGAKSKTFPVNFDA